MVELTVGLFMDKAVSLFTLGVVCLVFFTTYLLYVYADRKRTPWYALAVVWFCWFCSFSIVCLIPLDVAESRGRSQYCPAAFTESDCQALHTFVHRLLQIVWRGLFWAVTLMGWVVIPVVQAYIVDMHFTAWERLQGTLRTNLLYYLALAVIAFIAFCVLVAQGFTWERLQGLGMAASSLYGMLVIIIALGYGLFELPKHLWRMSNQRLTLNWKYFNVVEQLQACEKAKRELLSTLRLVRKYASSVAADHFYRSYVDTIVAECPAEFQTFYESEGTARVEYEKIVDLRRRLADAKLLHGRAKIIYQDMVRHTHELEDVVASANNPDRVVRWSFRPARTHRFARQFDFLEWLWLVHLRRFCLKLLALFCMAASLVIGWSEIFCWQQDPDSPGRTNDWLPDLSVLSLMVNGTSPGPVGSWLLVALPMAYLSCLCYWSLFRVGAFSFYRLMPNQQSDGYSLLANSYYVSVLAAPLVNNFLFMIHDQSTSFKQVMRPIKFAPILGTYAPLFFPALLILLALANLFNFYTWLLTTSWLRFCVKRFVFDDDYNDENIQIGREICAKEKEFHQRGLPISTEQTNVSLLNREHRLGPEAAPAPAKGKATSGGWFSSLWPWRGQSEESSGLIGAADNGGDVEFSAAPGSFGRSTPSRNGRPAYKSERLEKLKAKLGLPPLPPV